MKYISSLFFAVFFLLFSATDSYAATIYINSSTGNDSTGNGSSNSPYKSFNTGYTQAANDDIINLAGTFTWTDANETGDVTNTGFTIAKNLSIVGQGISNTVIQAAATDNIADRRIFTISSSTVVIIEDLTIRYGKTTSSSQYGGGIRNQGTLTVNKLSIHNNRASGAGGGGIATSGDLTINNSTIHSNVTNYMGGGVVNEYNGSGYLTITNSTITGNQVTSTVAYTEGGGVHFRTGSGTITNSTIAFNSAHTTGGVGIDDSSGTLTLKNTIIANNTSNWDIDFGFRQSGYGNVTDNGYNIIGKTSNYSFTGATDWLDQNRDGTFGLYNSDITGSLDLSSTLADNSTLNGTQTLAITGTESIAINNGASGTNGSISIPSTDQRGLARINTTDVGAYEYGGTSDSIDPELSSIADSPGSISTTITWNSDEASSSQVEYGLVNTFGSETSESDTSTRVTSHSVTLGSLKACHRYFYRVKSTDAASNQTISSRYSFVTSGCSVTSISGGTESSITTASGGEFELINNSSVAKLAVPDGFSSENADFQINRLSTTGMPSAPSNTALADEDIFDLSAVNVSDEEVTSFDESVTFIVIYGSNTETSFDESTLDIYRYNTGTGEWDDKNCILDTSANTITCSLTTFSIYAVFGEENPSESISSNLNSFSGKRVCSSVTPIGTPDLFQINTTSNTATVFFTPVIGVKDYYLSFSEQPFAQEHGAVLNLDSLGVQSYQIKSLKDRTKYYFKVRGYEDCTDANWSGIKLATTKSLYSTVSSPSKLIEDLPNNVKGVEIEVNDYISEKEDKLFEAKTDFEDDNSKTLIQKLLGVVYSLFN